MFHKAVSESLLCQHLCHQLTPLSSIERFFVFFGCMHWTQTQKCGFMIPPLRVRRRVLTEHMERQWRDANRDRENKQIPWDLNIQIANVSNHLRQLAEERGQYSHVLADCSKRGTKMSETLT